MRAVVSNRYRRGVRDISAPLPNRIHRSYIAGKGGWLNFNVKAVLPEVQVETADARGGDDKQRADPKTNSGQGSKSAFDEMKRRARAKPNAPPPPQSKPGRDNR
jgi:hypothetical protein